MVFPHIKWMNHDFIYQNFLTWKIVKFFRNIIHFLYVEKLSPPLSKRREEILINNNNNNK